MAIKHWRRVAFQAATTFICWCTAAQADPISAFLSAAAAYASSAAAAVGFDAATSAAIGTFAEQAIVTTAISLGASAVLGLFQQSPSPTVFNIKVDVGPRRHACGKVKLGGQALFGAFDASGSFWYLIAHCDEELVGAVQQYWLDSYPVTMDGSEVTDAIFSTTVGGFLGVGAGNEEFYQIWTQTFSPSNPVPPALAGFKSAFSSWTDDHKLAGVTYSIVKINAVDDKSRPAIYKWQQGAFHLGEAGLSITGSFGRVYDPRDNTQDISDQSTWKASSNAVLIAAWNRYRPYGFGFSMDDFNWTLIGTEADICDETVVDKNGVSWPRYGCGIQFDESSTNVQIEQQILACCDGIVLYDDTGKIYFKAGRYEAPTLTLTAARDILGMASQVVEDGESQLDGVVVTYTEPSYGYIQQPCAPWYNPQYYDDGTLPNLQQVTIPGIQSHNQAVRIAKAIGEMMQPAYKLAPTIGLRALLCRRQRIIGLDYDVDFTGDHQITAPVDFDLNARVGTIYLAPVSSTTWDLLSGEEGDMPRRDVTSFDGSVALPTGVVVEAQQIAGSSGAQVRIAAIFDQPPSLTYSYEFDYSLDAGTTWLPFEVVMSQLAAYTPAVPDGSSVEVRWRTVSSGGNYSDYSTPPDGGTTVTATADPTAPGVVTAVSATGGSGTVIIDWTAPASGNYAETLIKRNAVNTEGTASLVHTEPGAIGVADTWTDTGLTAGTYYYWLYAANGSGVAAAGVTTGAVSVS